MKAAAPSLAVNETVAVTNTPTMETAPSHSADLDVTLEEEEIAQLIPLKHPLPSHLPVLSMAAQDRHIVVIDTAHAVFVSKDTGKHWKAIHAPWQGHAVKADLVEHRTASAMQLSLRNAVAAEALQKSLAVPARTINGAVETRAPALSAANSSSLSGTVTDMSGAVIPGASVTVTDTATDTARMARTDATGRYLIAGLGAGTYKVGAQAAGFQKKELAGIAVPASGQATANLALPIGAASQSVTVQAASAEIDTLSNADAKSAAAIQPAPVFAITTDNGDRWTSTDGVTWKPL